jgi:D-lactate dehydrogenase
MDAVALQLARGHAGELVPLAGAMLMIEADGDAATLAMAVDALADAARGEGLIELRVAADAAEAQALWAARKALSPAQRAISTDKINEDVVVPVSQVPALVEGVRELSERYALPIVTFGHAGNGNLHVNLLPRDAAERERAPACLAEVFALVVALEGTLSGEHGIGLTKRPFMPLALEPATLALMHGVKQAFDPDGILNPGKVLP